MCLFGLWLSPDEDGDDGDQVVAVQVMGPGRSGSIRIRTAPPGTTVY